MIPKSGHRFSEKIMLKQKHKAGCRSNYNSSRFRQPSGKLPHYCGRNSSAPPNPRL
jgi:hypothetical protein